MSDNAQNNVFYNAQNDAQTQNTNQSRNSKNSPSSSKNNSNNNSFHDIVNTYNPSNNANDKVKQAWWWDKAGVELVQNLFKHKPKDWKKFADELPDNPDDKLGVMSDVIQTAWRFFPKDEHLKYFVSRLININPNVWMLASFPELNKGFPGTEWTRNEKALIEYFVEMILSYPQNQGNVNSYRNLRGKLRSSVDTLGNNKANIKLLTDAIDEKTDELKFVALNADANGFKNSNTRNNNSNNSTNSNNSNNAGNTFSSVCDTLITDADKAFQSFVKKVNRACVAATKAPVTPNSNSSVLPSSKQLKIRDADTDHPLESLMTGISEFGNTQQLPLEMDIEYIRVNYKNERDIGPGVLRDFITACVAEISSEFFEPIEGTDYHTLRKDLDLNKKLVKQKLVAVGYVLGIMAYNNVSFDFNLKKSLLHMCLYNTNPKKDVTYLVYELLEQPDAMKFINNLLKDRELVEQSDLNYEDIDEPSKQVTAANFEDYLLKWNAFYNVPQGMKYVAQGFHDKTRAAAWAKDNGMDVTTLAETVCNPSVMDPETIDDFLLHQVQYAKEVPEKVESWFDQIIQEGDREFFRSLLHFWSGQYTPMKKQVYQVAISGTRVATENSCPYPQSRTCYTRLILPQGVPSKQKLKSILENAISYAGKGVALLPAAGGKARRTKK